MKAGLNSLPAAEGAAGAGALFRQCSAEKREERTGKVHCAIFRVSFALAYGSNRTDHSNQGGIGPVESDGIENAEYLASVFIGDNASVTLIPI